ncbi:MAG: hypothetical protein C0404_02445 [Verrucomicrobia bacterium]|nr:hypothetical protein [Verrucomicrobiota bacterium]
MGLTAVILLLLPVSVDLAKGDLTQNAGLDLTAGGNDLLPGTGISFVNHVWTGDGTRLNMGTYYIRNVADGSGFTLDLANGSITNGGLLGTTQNGQPGSIIATNVSGVDVSGISTVCSNDGAAWTVGSVIVTGQDSGSLNVGPSGVQTYYTRGGNSGRAGDVYLQYFNSVTIGGSVGAWQGQRYSGSISIGTPAHPIGGAITVNGAVATFSGSAEEAQGAPISLYANGPVSVGELRSAISRSLNAQNAGCAITVSCRGAFNCGGITNGVDRNAALTSVSINGTDSSGAFASGAIDAHRTCFQGGAGTPVSITNFASVTINGDIRTDVSACYQGPWSGGNLTVSNITGNVTIAGSIDLRGARENAGYSLPTHGNLNLSSSKSVTLSGLDMGKINVAMLDLGTKGTITSNLTSFVTNWVSGGGTVASPYVTTQQMLRVSSGKRLYYNKNASTNSYLDGKTYQLADLAGVAGNGGLLTPTLSKGTVYIVH